MTAVIYFELDIDDVNGRTLTGELGEDNAEFVHLQYCGRK